MFYKQFLFILCLLPPLLFGSCDKDRNSTCLGSKLPVITSTGLNTFGCRIDVEDWLPSVKSPTYPDPLFIPALVINYSEECSFLIFN